MKGHVHAALMAQYAEDAKTNEKPWELWQWKIKLDQYWSDLISGPKWHDYAQYRRKPKTISINGFEVHEPLRDELKSGEEYYYADVSADDLCFRDVWTGAGYNREQLARGIVHRTKEAAALHGMALLSFTSGKTVQEAAAPASGKEKLIRFGVISYNPVYDCIMFQGFRADKMIHDREFIDLIIERLKQEKSKKF